MIKAVIFDMDGVLIEAKEWHYDSLNRALSLFGYQISRYDHVTTFDGLPTRRKLEMLTIENKLPKELHDFINEMKQIYTMELIHAQCKPRFVHEYALSKLVSLGYKLAVASNSIRPTVELMMQKSHLDTYLSVILSSDDVLTPKPSPDIYIKAINKLGISPKECLIVEDNENGIKAAKASGAHVMVVHEVEDVNIENILKNIELAERGAN